MERNYEKELVLAHQALMEANELKFAYMAMYNDAQEELKQLKAQQSHKPTVTDAEVLNVE